MAKEEERQEFNKKIENDKSEGRIIIPIDESGFADNMPRTHGYAPKGIRCYDIQDWRPGKRTNVIGALMGDKLLTVSMFECNINTTIFNSWVKQDLIPKLPKNSVLIMDNAGFHKSPLLIEMIKKAGHKLEYLPAYSPDLNPIESKWAQSKAKRRKYRCDIDLLFQRYIT